MKFTGITFSITLPVVCFVSLIVKYCLAELAYIRCTTLPDEYLMSARDTSHQTLSLPFPRVVLYYPNTLFGCGLYQFFDPAGFILHELGLSPAQQQE